MYYTLAHGAQRQIWAQIEKLAMLGLPLLIALTLGFTALLIGPSTNNGTGSGNPGGQGNNGENKTPAAANDRKDNNYPYGPYYSGKGPLIPDPETQPKAAKPQTQTTSSTPSNSQNQTNSSPSNNSAGSSGGRGGGDNGGTSNGSGANSGGTPSSGGGSSDENDTTTIGDDLPILICTKEPLANTDVCIN